MLRHVSNVVRVPVAIAATVVNVIATPIAGGIRMIASTANHQPEKTAPDFVVADLPGSVGADTTIAESLAKSAVVSALAADAAARDANLAYVLAESAIARKPTTMMDKPMMNKASLRCLCCTAGQEKFS